jgi:hypothetical protein
MRPPRGRTGGDGVVIGSSYRALRKGAGEASVSCLDWMTGNSPESYRQVGNLLVCGIDEGLDISKNGDGMSGVKGKGLSM